MVVPSLAVGGAVGVILSGGYLYWEVGKFAAPQVPTTVFDERKLLAGYTVGLFVGVPIAAAYLLLLVALANGALVGAATLLVGLVGGAELAQLLALRLRYWKGPAAPFYALGLRAGIGGILALAVVSTYLGASPIDPVRAVPTAVGALAVVALEVTGALVTVSGPAVGAGRSFRPLSGLVFGLFGFFLVGVGTLEGLWGSVAGSAVAALGSLLVYRRLRVVLTEVPPPGATPVPPEAATASYGRTQAEAGPSKSPADRPLP